MVDVWVRIREEKGWGVEMRIEDERLKFKSIGDEDLKFQNINQNQKVNKSCWIVVVFFLLLVQIK